jgi:hypothetical protein
VMYKGKAVIVKAVQLTAMEEVLYWLRKNA